MKRSVVVIGVILAVAAGRFAAQETRPAGRQASRPPANAQAGLPETELNVRIAKLEERTQEAEERIDRLKVDTDRLKSALERSETTVATLSKQVKTIVEAHERLARAVSVDPSGAVRITGNLRLENNLFEEVTVVNCDTEGTSGRKRQCTCPSGLVTVGIELKPLALSAYPGPATYNTALVCGRI
jgi:hypothetical protein